MGAADVWHRGDASIPALKQAAAELCPDVTSDC